MIARCLGVRIFDVEVSSACNLHCRFCPREKLPETGLMSEKTFASFLDGVRLGGTDNVAFVGMGEPTLNPKLGNFIREIKLRYPKTITWVTSNGTTLSEERMGRLIEAGLDILDVSFNGIDAKTYEGEMCGAKFETTLANVEAAAAQIERSGSSTRLQINYIQRSDIDGHGQTVRAFWHKRGVRHFRVQRLHDRAGNARLEGRNIRDFGLHGRACNLFCVNTFITWRGDVLHCCHDVSRAHVIGNICSEGLDTIMARKKTVLRDGAWPAICAKCTDPLRFEIWNQIDAEIRDEIRRKLTRVWDHLEGAWREGITGARRPVPGQGEMRAEPE